jgi:hypothetical protein
MFPGPHPKSKIRPAFYSAWFLNRLRAGYVDCVNPYNPRQVRRVSLKPEDVDVIVF